MTSNILTSRTSPASLPDLPYSPTSPTSRLPPDLPKAQKLRSWHGDASLPQSHPTSPKVGKWGSQGGVREGTVRGESGRKESRRKGGGSATDQEYQEISDIWAQNGSTNVVVQQMTSSSSVKLNLVWMCG